MNIMRSNFCNVRTTQLYFFLMFNHCESYLIYYCLLASLKKTLNMWSQRDLSILVTIYIIKTLALSKLIFICSVMNTPKEFSKEVKKITFDFVWNYKAAKIKKTTLKQKRAGGLDMKDFSLFDKALKLSEVKRLCSDLNASWHYIPKSLLADVGGTELFNNFNYDYEILDLNNPTK